MGELIMLMIIYPSYLKNRVPRVQAVLLLVNPHWAYVLGQITPGQTGSANMSSLSRYTTYRTTTITHLSQVLSNCCPTKMPVTTCINWHFLEQGQIGRVGHEKIRCNVINQTYLRIFIIDSATTSHLIYRTVDVIAAAKQHKSVPTIVLKTPTLSFTHAPLCLTQKNLRLNTAGLRFQGVRTHE